MKGLRQISITNNMRRPITINLLEIILLEISKSSELTFNKYLWSALFSTMYYACLRVGEAARSTSSKHTLQFCQIATNQSNGTTSGYTIRFKSFKHNNASLSRVFIHSTNTNFCPVKCLTQYLLIRGNQAGDLFLLPDGHPLTRIMILRHLRRFLEAAGINSALYNCHSFRIGRATDMLCQNYSAEVIKKVGRWNSDAYTRYLRPETITAPGRPGNTPAC